VVGGRLGGAVRVARGALRNGVEYTDRLPTGQPAGQLRCAGDRGGDRRLGIAAAELRGPPDAARVEQALTVAVHLAAVHIEAEDPCTRNEEGTALLEEGLDGREVENGRNRLHLPEVGGHGCVERQ